MAQGEKQTNRQLSYACEEALPDGLRIGLAFVKAILGPHNGEVRAFSEGPGKESSFKILIPCIEGEYVTASDVEIRSPES